MRFLTRKYLIASCDQSLKRMGLDYVDIFYSHRVDPKTPLEETMGALAHLHRQGKALYVGISSYSPELTRKAHALLKAERQKFLAEQWPRIAATIQRLGITPKELLKAAKRGKAKRPEVHPVE